VLTAAVAMMNTVTNLQALADVNISKELYDAVARVVDSRDADDKELRLDTGDTVLEILDGLDATLLREELNEETRIAIANATADMNALLYNSSKNAEERSSLWLLDEVYSVALAAQLNLTGAPLPPLPPVDVP
ncbi:hypothetical protein CYMTET_17974, partial [Cymbomonas tetramitiformis]